MSITDELRKWLKSLYTPNSATLKDEGERIADRIDAEHEDAVRKKAARMLTKTSEYMNDDDLAEIGLVRLPKDADGEYIRIGDVMRLGGVERDLTVLGIGINCERDHDMGVFVRESDDYVWYNARFLRHHHAPTVEDVLREMCLEIDHRCERGSIDYDKLFAEYAAKLQLREDA